MSTFHFPRKLNLLLDQCKQKGETSITWRTNGCSFQVVQRKRFAEIVMPVHFRSNYYNTVSPKRHVGLYTVFIIFPSWPSHSLSSYFQFQRNLNLWGSRITSKNDGMSIYCHEDFREGEPDRCLKMTRVGAPLSNLKKRAQVDTTDPIQGSAFFRTTSLSSSSVFHDSSTSGIRQSTWSLQDSCLLKNHLRTDSTSPHTDSVILGRDQPVADIGQGHDPRVVVDLLLDLVIREQQGRSSIVSQQEQFQQQLQSLLNNEDIQGLLNSQSISNRATTIPYLPISTSFQANLGVTSKGGSTLSSPLPSPLPSTHPATEIIALQEFIHSIYSNASEVASLIINHHLSVSQKRKRNDDSSFHVQSTKQLRWMWKKTFIDLFWVLPDMITLNTYIHAQISFKNL